MVSQLPRVPAKASAPVNDPQHLQRLRHTCAHVLAMAVQTLFPETKVTIGPCTDTGFYYDFDRADPFTPEDLERIAAEMRHIIQANLPIIRETVERDDIRAEIEHLNEPYKLEILDSIPAEEPITRYYIGCPDPLPAAAEPSLFNPPPANRLMVRLPAGGICAPAPI
jgi:threonyl-tRNA synthetase